MAWFNKKYFYQNKEWIKENQPSKRIRKEKLPNILYHNKVFRVKKRDLFGDIMEYTVTLKYNNTEYSQIEYHEYIDGICDWWTVSQDTIERYIELGYYTPMSKILQKLLAKD